MGVRHENYCAGYRSGRVLAENPERDYEGELKLNVKLCDAPANPRRAFALGELRGYRDAKDDRPIRVVTVPGTISEWKADRIREMERMQSEAMRASNAGAWDEA